MVNIFRFKHPVFKNPAGVEFRADGPIPITAGEKLLGYGHLADINSHMAVFNCAIDPACPERLDIELKKNVYMDVFLEYRGFMSNGKPTVAHIKELVLISSPIDGQVRIEIGPVLG